MLAPCPPSPPEGPPRGTYFSRRNATQPLPPWPPFTNIFASSANTKRPLSSQRRNCCKNKTVPDDRDRKKIADRSPPEFMVPIPFSSSQISRVILLGRQVAR